jgi:hypothetical protein
MNRLSSRGRTAVRIAIPAAALLLLSIGVIATRAAADESALRGVVTAALHAQQEVAVPPASYGGGPMSTALQQELSSNGRQELAKVFAKGQLEQAEKNLDAVIAAEAPGDVLTLGAGINNIDITSVEIDGDSATATATADLWASFAQVQADGSQVPAHPTNTKLFTLSLSRIDGSWYVVSEYSTFAPGSEP